MKFDIMVNVDILLNKNNDSEFLIESEIEDYSEIAEAVDSLIKHKDKVSLRNISIITEISTRELEDYIPFILRCETAAVNKYK